MKVLIAGGVKTNNIVNSVKNRFKSIGVDFLVVKYIDEIDEMFNRGEFYDRALILEPCWNRDGEDNEESSKRIRLNTFSKNAKSRHVNGMEYVILAQSEEEASIVYDETLHIKPYSKIVVKKPPYSVNFFVSLISSDLDRFPENLVYDPVRDIEKIKIESKGSKEIQETIYKEEEVADLSKELYDIDGISAPGLDDIDLGVDIERSFEDIEDDIVDEEDIDEEYMDEIEEEEEEIEEEEEDLFEDEVFDPSGQLPEFGGMDTGEWDGFDITEERPEPDKNYIDGVDDIGLEIDIEDSFEEPVEEPVEEEKEEEEYSYSDLDNDSLFDSMGYDDDICDKEDGFNIVGKVGGTTDVNVNIDTNIDNIQKEVIDNSIDTNVIIDNDLYEEEEEKKKKLRDSRRKNMNADQIKSTLDAFANRGNSIVVTGCGGCGTSTIAYNLANTIANIGYTVLLVDLDTVGRTQSYINKQNYDCMEHDGANLLQALNSSSGINSYVSIIRPGFRLLSMGLGGDIIDLNNVLKEQKMARFLNLAKSNYNFVIYDVPFDIAVGCASDMTYMADNILLVTEGNNWGISKMLLKLCNIDSEDMQDTIFSRGQILFNKCKPMNRVLGKKLKKHTDIPKLIDIKISELLGDDPGYYVSDMHNCGFIEYDDGVEECWYSNKAYSDTDRGYQIFTELLKRVVLKL